FSRRSAGGWPGDRVPADCAERRAEDCAGSEADDSDRPEVNSQQNPKPGSDDRDIVRRALTCKGTAATRLLDGKLSGKCIGGRYDSFATCIRKRSAPAAHHSSG